MTFAACVFDPTGNPARWLARQSPLGLVALARMPCGGSDRELGASLLTSARKHLAAVTCGHSAAKPYSALAFTFGWLICPLHFFSCLSSYRPWREAVSFRACGCGLSRQFAAVGGASVTSAQGGPAASASARTFRRTSRGRAGPRSARPPYRIRGGGRSRATQRDMEDTFLARPCIKPVKETPVFSK
jgi:hypothetical protein